MKLPNKVIAYQESIIAKFPLVLSILKQGDLSIGDLYMKIKPEVSDVGEYLEILDSLYALRKIDFIEETEALHYVD